VAQRVEQLAELTQRLDDIILAPHGLDHKQVAWLEIGG
jgi:hypothetical protein